MLSTKKITLGLAIVLPLFLIISFLSQQRKTEIPDLSQDKTAQEMGLHILSSNTWFTCPDQNSISKWIHTFTESKRIRVGSEFTEEDYVTLFKDNPLYWSCLVTNVNDYLGK